MIIVRRLLTTIALVLGLGLLALTPAAADEHEATYTEPGPVDLSGSDHATGNVGARVTLGALDVDAGQWTVTAAVTLFVPDVEGVWKNSQGCGLYSGGEQLGGAGGSSGLWEPTAGGKHVTLDRFLVPPNWEEIPILVEGPATVELECFIDQSHGGAKLEQRDGMAATDITLAATRLPDPEQPSITHPVCGDPGILVIPEAEGVTYEPAGNIEIGHGDQITVNATGPGVSDTTWSFTAIEAGCGGEQGDTGPAGADGEDADPVTVEEASASVGELPETGAGDLIRAVMLAGALLAAGGLLIHRGRGKPSTGGRYRQ